MIFNTANILIINILVLGLIIIVRASCHVNKKSFAGKEGNA
jgi:hypothetical protein